MAKVNRANLGRVAVIWACALLAGCASTREPARTGATPAAQPGGAAASRYRCDHGIEFSVAFAEDSAMLDAGPLGKELLLRDAGGLTPQHTVYSNPRLRAEFGLGAEGSQAILHYLASPVVARCLKA